MNIKLVPYTDSDYEFVYEVKKNAYIKYVEACWGPWNEEVQRNPASFHPEGFGT